MQALMRKRNLFMDSQHCFYWDLLCLKSSRVVCTKTLHHGKVNKMSDQSLFGALVDVNITLQVWPVSMQYQTRDPEELEKNVLKKKKKSQLYILLHIFCCYCHLVNIYTMLIHLCIWMHNMNMYFRNIDIYMGFYNPVNKRYAYFLLQQ